MNVCILANLSASKKNDSVVNIVERDLVIGIQLVYMNVSILGKDHLNVGNVGRPFELREILLDMSLFTLKNR
jgi:hypothetical protein